MSDIIRESVARTLFVNNWADRMEEAGETYPGMELMEVAPETSEYAIEEAEKLIREFERLNGWDISTMYVWAMEKDKNPDPELEDIKAQEDFGFYLAMQALGHGVSWSDDHVPHGFNIPMFEFFERIPEAERLRRKAKKRWGRF